MRIEEKMLILPALYIVKRNGKATTSDLIAELTYVFNPSGEDAEILVGRNDTKFSQKVRNLVSHRENNGMDKYTEFVEGTYTLTSEGENYLNTRIDELNYFFSQKFIYDDTLTVATNIADSGKEIFIYDENVIVDEGKIEKKISKSRVRSRALRDAAIDYYSNKVIIRFVVCGFSYEEKYGGIGKSYIEIHHEKPICEYDVEGKAQFMNILVRQSRLFGFIRATVPVIGSHQKCYAAKGSLHE